MEINKWAPTLANENMPILRCGEWGTDDEDFDDDVQNFGNLMDRRLWKTHGQDIATAITRCGQGFFFDIWRLTQDQFLPNSGQIFA